MAELVRVTVRRYDPRRDPAPYDETYEVPGIAYRVSCHRGICASCRMKVNGKARLACCYPVAGGDVLRLEPASPPPVIKDLVIESDWRGFSPVPEEA